MEEAKEAVTRAAAQSSSVCGMLKSPSGIKPITTAVTLARNPTTMAWHCGVDGEFRFRDCVNSAEKSSLQIEQNKKIGDLTREVCPYQVGNLTQGKS